MYDEVVRREGRVGDHCKILVLPDGSMKAWEGSGLCFDRPAKNEVAWVRLGWTREAAYLKRRRVRGEMWFLGPPRAWAQLDWTAVSRYASSDVGVEWVPAVEMMAWQKKAHQWMFFDPYGPVRWPEAQS